MAGIDRRKKKSQPHERQQGSAATATATKTGVTIPKITPPSTPSYYGGGGSQAVKPYTSGSQKVLPSAPPKTTTPTPTTTSTSSASSYVPPLPSFTDAVKSIATGQTPRSWTSTPWVTTGSPKGGTGGGSGGGGGGGSRGSGSRSQTPTIKAPTQFTPTYSGQPTGGPPPEEWPADTGTGTGVTWWGSGGGPQFIYDWQTEYQNQLKQLKEDELLLATQLNQQFLSQIDGLISEYTQYYEQMGQGVDPATEAALARLKQEMEQDQKSILEYLNTRGVAQSGMTTAEFGKLAGQYSDQKSQMLAGRLTDLQNQFLTNMRGFMDQKIQGMGQFTQNAMGVQQRYTQGMQGAMQNAMDMTFGEWQRQQQERAAMEQSMIPYTQGPTPYQQQQIGLQRQSQSQQAAYQNQQAQRAAQQQQAQAATNEAVARLSSYPTREAAENSIRNTATGLAQMGVDVNALYQALDRIFPPTQYNYFNQ